MRVRPSLRAHVPQRPGATLSTLRPGLPLPCRAAAREGVRVQPRPRAATQARQPAAARARATNSRLHADQALRSVLRARSSSTASRLPQVPSTLRARIMSESWNRRPGRTSSWITKNRRHAIYRRDGYACVYCTSPHRGLSLDHLRPRCKGGGNESTNLVTACGACNSVRQHQSVRAFCLNIASLTNQDWRAVVARVKNQSRKKAT